MLFRSKLQEIYDYEEEKKAAISIQSRFRGHHLRRLKSEKQHEKEEGAALMIQRHWRGRQGRRNFQHALDQKHQNELDQQNAATKIQSRYRARIGRKTVDQKRDAIRQEEQSRKAAEAQHLAEEKAALMIQTRYRGHRGQLALHLKQSARRQLIKEETIYNPRTAASSIQRAARCRMARDLLSNKQERKRMIAKALQQHEEEF